MWSRAGRGRRGGGGTGSSRWFLRGPAGGMSARRRYRSGGKRPSGSARTGQSCYSACRCAYRLCSVCAAEGDRPRGWVGSSSLDVAQHPWPMRVCGQDALVQAAYGDGWAGTAATQIPPANDIVLQQRGGANHTRTAQPMGTGVLPSHWQGLCDCRTLVQLCKQPSCRDSPTKFVSQHESHPCCDSFPRNNNAIVNCPGSDVPCLPRDLPLVGRAPKSFGSCFPFSIATAAYPADLPPRARGMVVVTGQNKVSGNPDDAMSSSDAEDDFQEPATPTATQAGQALPLLPQQFPEVVPLNVGGMYFTTRLSTLRRYEDTMLAAMFSGRHYIPTDAEGRYFIDRDGTYFGDILNFLRSGDLPPRERVRAVYKEAQYYSIGPLLDNLEDIQPLKGEKVRQAFLGLMPYYKDHLERIIEIAKLRAMQRKARFAKLKVCVFKEEMPITPYECPHFNSLRFERSESETKLFEHHCEVDVSFGPWEAVADVYDLLHCIVTDLSDRGITVDHQCIGVCDKHLINHYYCKHPIYEFKITWW